MERSQIIEKTAEFVRHKMEGEGSGHDWWHIVRVRNNALQINKKEKGADKFVIELACLLHDIADWKFNDGDLLKGSQVARKWLESLAVNNRKIDHICGIIESISFKGAGVKRSMFTLEGKIVQDADRLDAIGAIGIARTFAYGRYKGRELYNPDIKPEKDQNFQSYRNNTSPTINHFYEKLLLLKNQINTETARELAQSRHKYMEDYLDRFYKEWNG